MTFDQAFEELGELVSQAGGDGYEALEAVKGAVARLRTVLDCINLYGDETLHKALDAIGWPNA